jgi:hypothetical protein
MIFKKTQKAALHWKSRPPVSIGLSRVEMLVLLFPHGRWRKFLPWDGQIGPVILGWLHWLQVGGILLYVMSHMLTSTIWNVIAYQHLSHDSRPLCFLTPHLVPINIYLCSLVIFVRVLTTKVTESCSLKSWFILGLTMRTAMLRLDPLPLVDGLPLSPRMDAKDSWTDNNLTTTYLSWLPSNSIP